MLLYLCLHGEISNFPVRKYQIIIEFCHSMAMFLLLFSLTLLDKPQTRLPESAPDLSVLATRRPRCRASRIQDVRPGAEISVIRTAALHLGAGSVRVGGVEVALAHILYSRDIVAQSVFPAKPVKAILLICLQVPKSLSSHLCASV